MNMGGKSGNSPSLPAARGTPTGVNGILSESELSKSRTITQAQVARRRLDCPAFRRALETGQTKRRTIQTYTVAHSTVISEALRSLRVWVRICAPARSVHSGFRNARSVRRAIQRK